METVSVPLEKLNKLQDLLSLALRDKEEGGVVQILDAKDLITGIIYAYETDSVLTEEAIRIKKLQHDILAVEIKNRNLLKMNAEQAQAYIYLREKLGVDKLGAMAAKSVYNVTEDALDALICKVRDMESGPAPAEAVPSPEHRTTNVGASDYASRSIQPWDIWAAFSLNPWDADIIKRVLRVKNEDNLTPLGARIQDYKKIRHVCEERIHQLENGDPYHKNMRVPPWVKGNL